MAGIKQPIKTRLIYFTGLIVLLFILFFILQYNNYIFTRKTIAYHEQINQTQIDPGKIQVLHYRFIKNDIFTDQFYSLEKSNSFDSIISLIASYKRDLERIDNTAYLSLGSKTTKVLVSLVSECDNLTQKYVSLKKEVLERGLYTTGKSGEWHRFCTYLQELAVSCNNSSLIKNTGTLNKLINEYQLNKSNEKIKQLLENINSIKVDLNTRTGASNVALNEVTKLKIIKELDTFYALTLDIQKTDANIGLLNGEGSIGEIELRLAVLKEKSQSVYEDIKSVINDRLWFSFLLKIFLIILLGILFVSIITFYAKGLNSSIEQIKNFSSELMLGKLPYSIKLSSNSDFVSISDNFNNFIASLREKIKFASKLESGQTGESLKPLSEEDILANALLDMEKSLKKASEEDQKYKIEEQKRAWTNEGIARFGEILRMQTDNLATLSDEIIGNIVKYLHANQGGIFLYNDDDKFDIHLELISAFAFDRKKYLTKRIEIGEGLVGTCAQEKQTIFLTDLPENYIELTSGLGDAVPRSLLIVPMMTEKNIFGIIEVASLNIFQPFEIEFLEKLAENMASTFATVKININTSRLLEQSKKQAEEMAQQEEEMRQNLEELQATQEESARREAEIKSLINAVDSSAIVIQTDMDGRIIEVNKKFSNMVKMGREELIGRYLKNILMFDSQTDEFFNLLLELKKGKVVTRNEETHADNHQAFLQIHYSPILDREGNPYKILGIATNVTSHKLMEKTLEEKNEELSQLDFSFNQYKEFIKEGFITCELSTDAFIKDVNENYSEISGYHRDELKGKDYRKFLRPEELKQFESIWIEVLKDKTYKGVIKHTKPTGDECWLMTSFVPVKNNHDIIDKIFLFAQDVTEKKLKYQILEDANKEIDRLKGFQKSEE
jgi:PAS domain S-box-containing protein